jgi:hypothetical protein
VIDFHNDGWFSADNDKNIIVKIDQFIKKRKALSSLDSWQAYSW